MLSIVFARYIIREFNIDGADPSIKNDDLRREYMYSYGTGRKCTEHGFAYALS